MYLKNNNCYFSCSKILVILLLLFCNPVSAQLSADFSTNISQGCSPLVIYFTNTTTGTTPTATYTWDLGNGNFPQSKNAGAIYRSEGQYIVTLTVKDGNSSSSKSKIITVYASPSLDFTISPVKGCLPVLINFTANATAGSGSISSYYWDYGDGNTQLVNTASISHSYIVSQDVSVNLTVTNSFGCTRTLQKDHVIKIIPPIKAGFSADLTVLCNIAQPINFKDSSSGPGTLSYLWNFGDGTTSTVKNPSHIFNKAGIFTITHTVNSSEGCTATATQNSFINIASFKSDFSLPNQLCTANTITFLNTTNPTPLSANWLVDEVPASKAESNYLNYLFLTNGNHTIKLVNTFGSCKDSVTKTFAVKKSSELKDFSYSLTSNCGVPVVVNFKDTSAAAVKWYWDFNVENNKADTNSVKQNDNYTYKANGDYTVQLSIENLLGCTTSFTKKVIIAGPQLTIKTSNTKVDCGPYSVNFSATINSGSITTYLWNFGDGATSSLSNPSHLYNTPGKYPVILQYSTSEGCIKKDSVGVNIVYKIPVADFLAETTTACGNTAVTFNAVPQGDGITYLWNFGNGTSISGGPSIKYRFNKDSIYTITLIVISPGGCKDTLIRKDYITVLPPFPVIAKTTNTCFGSRGVVTFLQTSLKALSWKWDFGDGEIINLNSDQAVIQHTYSQSGKYKVTLTTTNGACTVSDSVFVPVLLKQSPILSATTSAACSNGDISITIKNLEKNNAIVGLQSDYSISGGVYKDGSIYKGVIKNTADTSGYWSTLFKGKLEGFEKGKDGIRLVVKSAVLGCEDTTNTIPLSINWSEPGYELKSNNVCLKSPVIFKDTSATNSKIILWQWNYGDSTSGIFRNGNEVSHIYANPSSYYTSLTITDANGCIYTTYSNTNDSIYINGPKVIINPPAVSYITLPVNFNNTTNNYKSNNTLYSWNFGDGNFSSESTPVHVYKTPGEYNITLIAKNPVNGCSDSARRVILIKDFKASFTLDSSFLSPNNCPPVLVQLYNTSINYTSVKWNFGDGSTAEILDTPSHIFEKAGKFIITLYAYGPEGLVDSAFDSIIVRRPEALLTVNKSEGCIGHTAVFKAIVQNTVSYTWDFGDGTVLLVSDSVAAHQYNQPGVYKTFLVLTDSIGCKSSAALKEKVIIRKDPPITFSPGAPVVCRGKSIAITASGGVEYKWSPAKDLNMLNDATILAKPASSFTYTVKITDDIGCTNNDSITVNVIQPLTISTEQTSPVCLGKTRQLFANGGSFYKWIYKTSDLSNTDIANPVAKPTETTEYIVTGTDAYRCFIDTATVTLNVLPLPVVTIQPVPETVTGFPVSLITNSNDEIVKWRWSPSEWLSCINCPSSVSTPLSPITYTVTVTDKNGCTSSTDVLIKLQCNENIVMIPSAFSPNNDGLNDVFILRGVTKVKHLLIYNRWGVVMFEKSNFLAGDRSNGWDGTYKSEPQPTGTYLYFAEIECIQGAVFTRKGTLVLVK